MYVNIYSYVCLYIYIHMYIYVYMIFWARVHYIYIILWSCEHFRIHAWHSRLPASRTLTHRPFCARRRAAASPEMPAPMMMASALRASGSMELAIIHDDRTRPVSIRTLVISAGITRLQSCFELAVAARVLRGWDASPWVEFYRPRVRVVQN